MAVYEPRVEIEYAVRQCKVKGKNAFFHRWSEVSDVLMPSAMVGGHKGGEVKKTLGIIEYVDDGTVHECYPNEIQFLDTKEKAMGYYWGDETRESEGD